MSRSAFLSLVLLLAACGARAPSGDDERLRAKIDRTPVHLAVAMRDVLAGGERDDALRSALDALRDAPASEVLAASEHAADAAWARRREGRSRLARADQALEPALAGERERWTQGEDHLAMLLAMVALDAHPEPRARARATKPVLLFEASRIDPGAVDPALAPLARALRASTFARGGLCALARPDADAALAAEPAMDRAAAAARLLAMPPSEAGEAAPDDAVSDAWVGLVVRSLARGAIACCAVRTRHDADAAASLDALVADARAADADGSTIALLETWAAVARDDRARARARLADVADLTLSAEEVAKYHVLRDRLASGPGGDTPALDRAWIALTTARIASRALVTSDALAALDRAESGRATRTARAVSRTLVAARALHPGFEQAADEGRFWEPLARLFSAER